MVHTHMYTLTSHKHIRTLVPQSCMDGMTFLQKLFDKAGTNKSRSSCDADPTVTLLLHFYGILNF